MMMTRTSNSGAARRGLCLPTAGHSLKAFAAAVLVAFAGCGRSTEPVSLVGETMGTTYSVKLAEVPDGESRSGLKTAIDAALERFDAQLSTWRADSELSRFNASDSTDWFPVSTPTATVIAASLETYRESGGAFDVTVLPLVDLWGFGAESLPDEIPADDSIAERRAYVGSDKLEVRLDPPALRKTDPRVSIDVSAIAPGYAVDLIADLLDARGVPGCMIELGGEVRTKGTKLDGTTWRLGIEKPLSDRRAIETVVRLSGESLATSGDYRHFFEKDGMRYSHTIDPRTGRPVCHALASVSVIADECMTADAFATTVMVLGPDEGYDWLVERRVSALLILRDGEAFVEKPTPDFQAKFGPSSRPPG